MFFYWRMMEELKFLGEQLIFNDPALKREYQRWLKKNAHVLYISEKKPFLFISLN